MRITREKPCQRRHHRVSAPLYVSVNQQEYSQAKDWSLSGLCIEDYLGETVNANDQVSLQVELPFQGYQISFEVSASVVRVADEDHAVFVEFIDLSERSFDLMKHFVDDLVRGKMATIDDTICRIDVPVTPISTAPTPNPEAELPVNRWPIKSIVMSTLYLLLGLVVFGYIAVIFYSNYFTLEVPYSVVSSKIQTMKMPLDGVLKPVNYEVGIHLDKGEPLFRIENQSISTQLLSLSVKIQKTENELAESKERYRIETERMKLYQLVSKTDTQILVAQLEGKKQEVKSADDNMLRVLKLKRNNALSAQELDDAKNRQHIVSFQLQELEAKLAQARAMESVSTRRHYNHKEFASDLDLAAIALQSLYSRLKIEKQQYSDLNNKQQLQIVRAPYTGKIVDVYHTAESSIPKNEPVLVFEETETTTVTAYLNQEEILQIGLNDLATVFIPAIDQHFEAIIIKIDRSSAYIDQKTAKYTWKDNKEKTALVTLEIFSEQEFKELLSAGLPAVVIFNRRSTNSLMSKFLNTRQDKEQPSISSGGSHGSI